MEDFSIITPHAAFLVWNYKDRKGGNKLASSLTSEVDQLIISTLSLKSISTSKAKSAAFGTFEVRLAPTKNWIQTLVTGSWCTILIGRDKLGRSDIDESVGRANSKNIKFFGRIESVRVAVSVDQATGARITEYIVTGADWGSVFNSSLYVDPALAWDAKNNDAPIGFISQLIYKQSIKAMLADIPSTVSNIKTLLKMWGSKSEDLGKPVVIAEADGLTLKPEIKFTMPKEVVKFFGFKNVNGLSITSNALIDLIQLYHGKLNKLYNVDIYEDSYDEFEESFGVIKGEDVLGQHNMWTIINLLGNSIINEITCDLRWSNDTPSLALYKRIKPFIINKDRVSRDKHEVGDNKSASGKNLDSYISEFKNIRRVEIPLNEIINFNAGTNWQDKINFIEIKPVDAQFVQGMAPQVRYNAQFYDKSSFSREGLRSLVGPMRYYPEATVKAVQKNKSTVKKQFSKKDSKKSVGETKTPNKDKATVGKNIEAITEWKYILKEWYFDTHRMLNGSMSFFVQDKYIQVGDNIITDAKITGFAENMTTGQIKNKGNAFLLAHVENISHSFTVGNNGERHGVTTVNFVRGIIVGEDGTEFTASTDDGLIEQDATNMGISDEINYQNTHTKTYMDPD